MYLAYDIIPYAFEPLVVFIIRSKKNPANVTYSDDFVDLLVLASKADDDGINNAE